MKGNSLLKEIVISNFGTGTKTRKCPWATRHLYFIKADPIEYWKACISNIYKEYNPALVFRKYTSAKREIVADQTVEDLGNHILEHNRSILESMLDGYVGINGNIPVYGWRYDSEKPYEPMNRLMKIESTLYSEKVEVLFYKLSGRLNKLNRENTYKYEAIEDLLSFLTSNRIYLTARKK